MASDAAQQRIEQLEAAIAQDPKNFRLRDNILSAFCANAETLADSRRLEHILWVVRHYPRNAVARCPLAWIPAEAPEEHALAVEREWQILVDAHPADGVIVRGLACFVADRGDAARALQLLRDYIRMHGGDAELWLDVGRIEQDAGRRLEAFQQARALGSENPNLLHWLATAAFDAEAMPEAETAARELMSRAAAARAEYGEAVAWLERGAEFRARASAITHSPAEMTALVIAHLEYANDKHWGETVLGLLAEKRGDVATAVEHLLRSAAVSGSPRLRSYGPSMRLADALCQRGEWEAVISYLKACRSFYDKECLTYYLSEAEQHRVPEWDDV